MYLQLFDESVGSTELQAKKEAAEKMKVEIRKSLDKQMRDREARKKREVRSFQYHFVAWNADELATVGIHACMQGPSGFRSSCSRQREQECEIRHTWALICACRPPSSISKRASMPTSRFRLVARCVLASTPKVRR